MVKEDLMLKSVELVKEKDLLLKWYNSDQVCILRVKPLVENVKEKEKLWIPKINVKLVKEIK